MKKGFKVSHQGYMRHRKDKKVVFKFSIKKILQIFITNYDKSEPKKSTDLVMNILLLN